MGVTEALRIINTVSEYLGNIDTGGPRCARGVNAPPAAAIQQRVARQALARVIFTRAVIFTLRQAGVAGRVLQREIAS